MQRDPSEPGGHEEQLYEVLLDYLESAERGVVKDSAELLARNPQIASELQEFIDTQNHLEEITAPVRWVSDTLIRAARSTGEPSALEGQAQEAQLPETAVAIGDYDTIRLLGRGSVGVVYEARQRTTGRLVALRIIQDSRPVTDPEAARFRLGLQAAATLDHPNIVPVYDVGEVADRVLISMRFLEGGSLKDRLGDIAAEPRAAAGLVAELARAVNYAHHKGVLHGSLRPTNILFDALGAALVADFGLAGYNSGLLPPGAPPGMPGYFAPEQIGSGARWRKGAAMGAARDIYGLGAILYALLTGRAPFVGPTAFAILEQVRGVPPATPRSLNPAVHADLEAICLKCLEKDPGDRYASAEELADEIGRYLSGLPIQVPHAPQKRLQALPLTAENYPFLVPPSRSGEIGWLGPYRLLKIVGGGGMGIVFRGEDTQLQRPVAVKVMRAELAADPNMRERMLREARLAAALEHEHVVTIYHVGEERGVPFLVMQWLRGLSLEQLLRESAALPVPVVLRLGQQIARGLAAAHAHGMLHRDIKPANLWVEPLVAALAEGEWNAATQGRIKILDFGLARVMADDAHLTQSGMAVGTPAYMAPEQAGRFAVDNRCDLYSLGVVLYRMCTGKLPDRTGAPRTEDGPTDASRLRELKPNLPAGLVDLITRLLAIDPARRPAMAVEVADRLQALERQLTAQGTPQAAAPPPPGPTARLPQPGRRRSWRTGVGVAAVALAMLLPTSYFFGGVVVRFATNRGKVVIAVDDPDTEVTVTEHGAVLRDRKGERQITLAAGEHELEVTIHDRSGEAQFFTKNLVLRRGGTEIVNVREELARNAPAPGPAEHPGKSDSSAAPPGAEDGDRQAANKILALGGYLVVRTASGEQAVRTVKELPGDGLQVVGADLGRTKVADADLASLKNLGSLRDLNLRQTSVTDSGLANLQGLTGLRRLVLSGASVNGEGLARLAGLKHLETLALDYTSVSDAGLAHLGTLTGLRTLDLTGARVTDAGLVHLSPLTGLQELRLAYNSRLGDAGLAHLKGLKSLRDLTLTGTSVSDAGLAHLDGMNSLRILSLSGTQITDNGLARLEGMNSLQTLNLARTRISDNGLKHVSALRGLISLNLGETDLSDLGLAHLSALTNLQNLSLGGIRKISDEGLAHLKDLKDLSYIDLDNTPIGDAGLANLASLKRLFNLRLGFTRVTDAGMEHLASLERLSELHLPGTHVDDAGIARLMKAPLPPLTLLVLNGTRLSATGAADVKSVFPRVHLDWWEPNRRAAESVLAAGGTVRVRTASTLGDASIQAVDKLPADYFRVTQVSLAGVRQRLADVLQTVGALSDREFDHLEEIDLSNTAVTDTDLANLGSLPFLRRLVLDGTPIRGAGLLNFRRDPALIDLSVNCPGLVDSGVRHLGELKQLERLSLANSSMTDAGLPYLYGLTHLRALDLSGTKVTAAGTAALRQQLPMLKIRPESGNQQ